MRKSVASLEIMGIVRKGVLQRTISVVVESYKVEK